LFGLFFIYLLFPSASEAKRYSECKFCQKTNHF